MQHDPLIAMMDNLRSRGCDPAVYKRGGVYRAHVNRGGNYWRDHKCAVEALRRAVAAWEKAGCPNG